MYVPSKCWDLLLDGCLTVYCFIFILKSISVACCYFLLKHILYYVSIGGVMGLLLLLFYMLYLPDAVISIHTSVRHREQAPIGVLFPHNITWGFRDRDIVLELQIKPYFYAF